MKIKTFFKFFLSFLVLFTLILIPIGRGVSNINIFKTSGEGTLEEQMDTEVLVSSGSPFFETFTEAERINVLMVGVNQDLTDTIMLVSWDMDANNVDVISVPRDTYYERKGYKGAAQKKINSIYGSEGIIGTANAVSDVLYGIPINYYAVVDYDAVKKIVDGIGGVPVDVPKAMKYDDPYDTPPLHISIPAGYQVLDGEHAIQYLRYRKGYSNGDVGRIDAQQVFVRAAFKQAISNGLIDSTKLVCKNVESDLTVGAATKFALKAIGLESDAIETYTLPGAGEYIGDVSYFIQDAEETETMLLDVYNVNTSDSEE